MTSPQREMHEGVARKFFEAELLDGGVIEVYFADANNSTKEISARLDRQSRLAVGKGELHYTDRNMLVDVWSPDGTASLSAQRVIRRCESRVRG